MDEIETDLDLLGATAIEDKLQVLSLCGCIYTLYRCVLVSEYSSYVDHICASVALSAAVYRDQPAD